MEQIKAQDLRIGNYVYNPGAVPKNRVVIVDIITPHNIEFVFPNNPRLERYYLRHKHLEGIPLTEEWLLKFDFKQGTLGSWTKSITIFGNLRELSFNGDYLYLREGKEVFGSGEDDLCVIWNKDVMKQFYVHQLQNLYFALTGEELTIKEDSLNNAK